MKKKLNYVIVLLIILIIVISVIMIPWKKEKNNETEVDDTMLLPWQVYRKTDGNGTPRNNYSKMVLDDYNGLSYKRTTSREIFLTFDAGYESGRTEEFLNIVNECGIKVAFFITDSFWQKNSQLVKKMIDSGHIVGNHTVHHYDLTKLSEDEIKNELMLLHNKVLETYGYEMKYYRPPQGLFSEKVLKVTKQLGYRAVLWGFSYDDWDENNQKGEEYAKYMIFNNIRAGQVILLHANSQDNLSVLKEFIQYFQDKGYQFKSLDEY